MIIVKLMGGLGNQMFQYALARHYQLKGNKVFLDTSFYCTPRENVTPRFFELSTFPITVPVLPEIINRFLNSGDLGWKILRKLFYRLFTQVIEKGLSFDPTNLSFRGNVVLSGYFQSENYFQSIQEKLKADFTFPELSPQNRKYEAAICQSNSISLHIRRGDYVNNAVTSKVHGSLPLSYYKDAIAALRTEVHDPTYFVFTDDPDWADLHLRTVLDHFVVVEGNTGVNSWEDMYLKSLCKHNILANSSFSWWAAWLNDNPGKKIIAPENWYADPILNVQTKALLPFTWIRIRNSADVTSFS